MANDKRRLRSGLRAFRKGTRVLAKRRGLSSLLKAGQDQFNPLLSAARRARAKREFKKKINEQIARGVRGAKRRGRK